MDQYVFELALLRAVERLIGVLLGGLTIWLGYRLFMNIPQATEGSAEIDVPGTGKLILTRIAPGVFFALFGVAVIGSSFFKSVAVGSYTVTPTDSLRRDSLATNQSPRTGTYNGSAQTFSLSREARARLLTDIRWATLTLNRTLDKSTAQERLDLAPAVETSKRAMIESIWNPEWGKPEDFRRWLDLGGTMPKSFTEPANLYQLTD